MAEWGFLLLTAGFSRMDPEPVVIQNRFDGFHLPAPATVSDHQPFDSPG
jgi:hypothetical protein